MSTTAQLERGMMLRDLPARTLDGGAVRASDFRGRRNLVLIFPGENDDQASLLNALRQSAAELLEEEAVVLIAEAPDDIGRLYSADGTAALYVTDRYGEIYFLARAPSRALPGVSEILDWLRFINAQCPE